MNTVDLIDWPWWDWLFYLTWTMFCCAGAYGGFINAQWEDKNKRRRMMK